MSKDESAVGGKGSRPVFKVVIPARFSSSRLPGKPLVELLGKPMIQRVYERCLASSAVQVIVATDDERIVKAVKLFDGEACMTRPDHASGTDRVMEVAEQLGWKDQDIVVNVQGDEPLIPAAAIDQAAVCMLDDPDCGIATLCEPIEYAEDLYNPSVVKVVFNHLGRALYFSRAPLPWYRDESIHSGSSSLPEGFAFYRHIGIYAYRVATLRAYVTWEQSMMEKAEKLEQLRALYQGVPIHVSLASQTMYKGVDTEDDLQRVREFLSREASGLTGQEAISTRRSG